MVLSVVLSSWSQRKPGWKRKLCSLAKWVQSYWHRCWQCWKTSSAFLAKQQQQRLTEGHNHSSAVDSAANLTHQHWDVRTVTPDKQTGLTILKAQNMWHMNVMTFDTCWSLPKIMVQTQNCKGPLLLRSGADLRPHKGMSELCLEN